MKNRNDNSCTANTLDWNPLADLTDTGDIAEAASLFLETEEYITYTAYDALNRPISLTTPDGSVNLPMYNEAGLLDKVQARLRGASVDDATPFVTNINYDAKGQRELVEYANGVYTEYTYDPLTFRVIRIRTIRTKDNACLQDLNYTYDPVGNITELRDNAQKTIFYDNAGVEPVNQYEYDALYRLIHAEGREHAGQNADAQPDHHNPPIIHTPHPHDAQAVRHYTEDYVYDEVGNILCMDHKFANGGWKRNYEYEEVSNRLESTSLPGDDPEGPYGALCIHDEHGNMTSMPHLPEMCWDFKDQMCQVDLNGGGTAYYVYDAGGQRARKVHEHNSSTVEKRIYLGGYETYRKHNGSGLTLERETLHIMDDQQRIALVETKTVEDGSEVLKPKALVRYQLNNHLGSSSLELDGEARVISYEEYYPYGSTSYQAVDKELKAVAKRYRYTGKERDDETGLYYYGARYYAAWLGRWTASDPAGLIDGINLYRYSQNNPVKLVDTSGTKSNEPKINNTDISEEYWQDNPNLIWNEESQLYHYTDPNTYGTWIGKEGQWIDYTPAEEITIDAKKIWTLEEKVRPMRKTILKVEKDLKAWKQVKEIFRNKLTQGIILSKDEVGGLFNDLRWAGKGKVIGKTKPFGGSQEIEGGVHLDPEYMKGKPPEIQKSYIIHEQVHRDIPGIDIKHLFWFIPINFESEVDVDKELDDIDKLEGKSKDVAMGALVKIGSEIKAHGKQLEYLKNVYRKIKATLDQKKWRNKSPSHGLRGNAYKGL